MEAVGTDMSCFDETLNKCYADQQPSEKCSSAAAAAVNAPASSSPGPHFDCSICLDFAVDPVVTLCGHLYCWPCIYKWLQVETTSPQQCPVCKSPVSQNALVPLYGRGNLTTDPKRSLKSRNIPNRPGVVRDMISSVIEEQHSPAMQRPGNHYDSLYPSQLGGASVFSSTAGGVIGGIAVSVLPLLSRNNYLSRPYQFDANWSTARERRQEQRIEESLHQLWVFLFCGAILCLLFF